MAEDRAHREDDVPPGTAELQPRALPDEIVDPGPTSEPGLADPGQAADPDEVAEPGTTPAAPRQGELMATGAMMAVGTLISRITGLMRDMAMTAALGLGIVADIFTLGNTIPNTVYALTVGGAMNAVFVPQLVRRAREDSDGGDGFADRLITLTGLVLLLIAVIAFVLAPLLTRIYASPQYTDDQLSLAVAFARFCLPQIFFYGLFTLLSQVLNARNRFGPPMYAPIANNIIAIAVFLSFLYVAGPEAVDDGTLDAGQVAWLGIGSTVAVAAQAVVLVPYLYSSGYRWRARFDWRGWGLGKTGTLALWTLGLLAANQVSFIVHSRLATTANVLAAQEGLPPAGIATFQKAHLIFFLPHSIVTVSLVTALLPGLSRVAHNRQYRQVSTSMTDTMRTVSALMMPITAVMVPLAPLLASVLFGYGASGVDAAQQIGMTVIGMLVGLIPFSLYFILLRGWYAMEDTRTPFFLSLVLNAIMVVLSLGLFAAVPTAWKVPAIGLAFGLTYWLMMLVAWPVLSRRLGGMQTTRTWLALGRILLAGLVSAAAALAVFWAADTNVARLWDSTVAKVVTLVVASLVGLVAYLLAARLLRVTEVARAMSLVRSRVVGR